MQLEVRMKPSFVIGTLHHRIYRRLQTTEVYIVFVVPCCLLLHVPLVTQCSPQMPSCQRGFCLSFSLFACLLPCHCICVCVLICFKAVTADCNVLLSRALLLFLASLSLCLLFPPSPFPLSSLSGHRCRQRPSPRPRGERELVGELGGLELGRGGKWVLLVLGLCC